MNKRELFIKAIAAGEYKRKEWVISAFAITNTSIAQVANNQSTVTTNTAYPYKIIQTPTGIFFLDPENELKATKIEDAKIGVPLYGIKEKVKFEEGDFINLDRDVLSTYGQALWNNIILVHSFSDSIKYMQGRITVEDIEKVIGGNLHDDPEEGKEKVPGNFYISQYQSFADAVKYIEQFTQLCVPAATKRTMLPAPGIAEFRDGLLKQYADKLKDPATIAIIDAALVKYDRDAMKGDLAEGFLITGKSYNVVRKKLFGMYGSEAGFTDGIKTDNVARSLSEGWDITKMPVLNNASRAGSFNRGAETQLGGEAVKWLLRASSNLRVKDTDCGAVVGKPLNVTEANYQVLAGFSVIDKTKKPIKITTEEEAKTYIGKLVEVRSPMYCRHTKTDFCGVCVGSKLNEHPTALSMAVSAYGSTFMGIFMSAMHGKQLALAKMNFKTAIS